MKLYKLKSKNIRNIVAGALAIALLAMPGLALAQTVTQSYGVTTNVQQGMIVQLDPADANDVEPLTSTMARSMLGAVIAASDAPVTLNGNATGSQVYVATSGKYEVLVSTQNGPVKAGDAVSISTLDGIGMKADANEPVVLGKALESFNANAPGNTTAQLKTADGTSAVSIGLVQVSINIASNPLVHSGNSTAVPAFLKKIAANIAGKPVSAPRIYISLAILLVSFLIAGSLLYGGVRSSLTAIGRNPLAKRMVLGGMFQVVGVGTMIFVVGLLAIYLLIKL